MTQTNDPQIISAAPTKEKRPPYQTPELNALKSELDSVKRQTESLVWRAYNRGYNVGYNARVAEEEGRDEGRDES